jgi:hypothetical protein
LRGAHASRGVSCYALRRDKGRLMCFLLSKPLRGLAPVAAVARSGPWPASLMTTTTSLHTNQLWMQAGKGIRLPVLRPHLAPLSRTWADSLYPLKKKAQSPQVCRLFHAHLLPIEKHVQHLRALERGWWKQIRRCAPLIGAPRQNDHAWHSLGYTRICAIVSERLAHANANTNAPWARDPISSSQSTRSALPLMCRTRKRQMSVATAALPSQSMDWKQTQPSLLRRASNRPRKRPTSPLQVYPIVTAERQ